jgi:hypothetical protein
MKSLITAATVAACLAFAPTVTAQAAKTYRTRLSPVPVPAFTATIVGTGTVTATLTGSRLSISGSYDGLASPATQAKIYKSPKPGIRGDAVLDLKVSGGTSGTITGQFDLTPAQVQELAANRYYVQLFSEKAAEGNLWGWLMAPQEKAR